MFWKFGHYEMQSVRLVEFFKLKLDRYPRTVMTSESSKGSTRSEGRDVEIKIKISPRKQGGRKGPERFWENAPDSGDCNTARYSVSKAILGTVTIIPVSNNITRCCFDFAKGLSQTTDWGYSNWEQRRWPWWGKGRAGLLCYGRGRILTKQETIAAAA